MNIITGIQYRQLQREEQKLQNSMKKLIVKLLRKNNGRITYLPEPDEDECVDYPVTMTFYGKHNNPSISITSVYFDEKEKNIKVDGVEHEWGTEEKGYSAFPEHYTWLLDFIATALGIPTTGTFSRFIRSIKWIRI